MNTAENKQRTAASGPRYVRRLVSPVIATFGAIVFTVMCMPHSFVGEVISDAAYRFPRVWRVIFWSYWKPGAFYYCWTRPTGGCGEARWMWRKPKHPRWEPATDWWVFLG